MPKQKEPASLLAPAIRADRMRPDQIKLAGMRAFAAVMEHGTLVAAARELSLSEPALSRQIAQLEGALALSLFSRERRNLVATPHAEAFAREVQGILGALDGLPSVLADVRPGAVHSLRIVAMPRLTTAITVPAIARFRDRHPNTMLSIDIHPRRHLERWVVGQQFDVGLGSLPARHAAIETEQLFSVPAVAVLPLSHPLAQAAGVRADQLLDDVFIVPSASTLIRRQIERMFEHLDQMPRASMVVSQTFLACGLVAEGAGVTVCDPMVAHGFRGRVALVPIEPRVDLHFGALFPKQQPRLAEAEEFIAIVEEVAAGFWSG